MARRRKPDPDEELDPDELAERLEEGERQHPTRWSVAYDVSLFMRDGGINPTSDIDAARQGHSTNRRCRSPASLAYKMG